MTRVFQIIGWEFVRYLKSRSFLLATLVTPLLLSAIIVIPAVYYQNLTFSDSRIGVVELDTTRLYDVLAGYLENDSTADSELLLMQVVPDTLMQLQQHFDRLATVDKDLDSLTDAYNKVNERRRYIFQRTPSRRKNQMLDESYKQLISTREQKDLVQIEQQRLQTEVDSMMRAAVLGKADSLLKDKVLSGYVIIDPEKFKDGVVEYHSDEALNFLRVQPLKHALQVLLVEERMKAEDLSTTRIEALLQPITIKEIFSEGSQKREFQMMFTYLSPIVVVMLLCLAIFTGISFLYSSLVDEKLQRIIDVTLSSIKPGQLFWGKLMGFGLLGLLQVGVWILITAFLLLINVLPAEELPLLNWQNAGIFLLYFALGYFFFGAIALALASLASSEKDAHGTYQWLKFLAFSPLAFALIVLQFPGSLLVKILSYIPMLTPSFMVLRTPLDRPEQFDYYMTAGVLVVAIAVVGYFAMKIFRQACLLHNDEASPIKTLVGLLQAR